MSTFTLEEEQKIKQHLLNDYGSRCILITIEEENVSDDVFLLEDFCNKIVKFIKNNTNPNLEDNHVLIIQTSIVEMDDLFYLGEIVTLQSVTISSINREYIVNEADIHLKSKFILNIVLIDNESIPHMYYKTHHYVNLLTH